MFFENDLYEEEFEENDEEEYNFTSDEFLLDYDDDVNQKISKENDCNKVDGAGKSSYHLPYELNGFEEIFNESQKIVYNRKFEFLIDTNKMNINTLTESEKEKSQTSIFIDSIKKIIAKAIHNKKITDYIFKRFSSPELLKRFYFLFFKNIYSIVYYKKSFCSANKKHVKLVNLDTRSYHSGDNTVIETANRELLVFSIRPNNNNS